jgi:hypothetical protein
MGWSARAMGQRRPRAEIGAQCGWEKKKERERSLRGT